tara:strand:+ start:2476 stop:3225 length:750 start_codon:yes stop_codon:yes gene_type:complete
MSEEAKSVLERLKEINETKGESIFLPSLAKKVKFRSFTLKQQKDLLAKLPDDSTGLLSFNNNFNSIILDNCMEDISLDSLNNFDRLSVILTYRITAVGNTVERGEKTIDLGKVIANVESTNYAVAQSVRELGGDGFKAEIKLCSLAYDSKINTSTAVKLKKAKNQQGVIAEMYSAEILKYIKSLTLTEGEPAVVDMYSVLYDEKSKIVDNLPNTFARDILHFVNEIKSLEDSIVTVDGEKIDISNELFG